MAKTEVYSWRVEPGRKMALESAARMAGRSLSDVLDEATEQWLKARTPNRADNDAEQHRLHAALLKCAGTISGGGRYDSENVSKLVRKRLREKYGR